MWGLGGALWMQEAGAAWHCILRIVSAGSVRRTGRGHCPHASGKTGFTGECDPYVRSATATGFAAGSRATIAASMASILFGQAPIF